MGKFLSLSILSAVIMVVWIVGYMTTYNVGYTDANNGPWFADTALAKEGWTAFQAAGCAQCHSILRQQGQANGPDLTYVGKSWQAPQIEKLVRNPRSIYANTIMPAFTNLSDDQVSLIARYLETLK